MKARSVGNNGRETARRCGPSPRWRPVSTGWSADVPVSVTAVLLGALDAVLAQWRADPTEENRGILEETYVAMVVGAYAADSGLAGGQRR